MLSLIHLSPLCRHLIHHLQNQFLLLLHPDATVTKTGSEDDVLNDDTADSDGLVITHIKKDGGTNSTVASGSTYVSNGTSVIGTYGTLTIGADGSYTYVATYVYDPSAPIVRVP